MLFELKERKANKLILKYQIDFLDLHHSIVNYQHSENTGIAILKIQK